jgi:hypothetical protein
MGVNVVSNFKEENKLVFQLDFTLLVSHIADVRLATVHC